MNPVQQFLDERKSTWLKAKLKSSKEDLDKQVELESEANDKFWLNTWLPDAASRASQITMVSHPSKFSHPNAKTSALVATKQSKADGYLRSGNVAYELDVFGNAAAMDVYKFLSVVLSDNRTILDHLEENSAEIQSLLAIDSANYEDMRLSFLKIKDVGTKSKTDPLVKQVYFPVDDGYHLLSLLTPSGLLCKVKERIDTMRFSDEAKEAREFRNGKEKKHHAVGFSDVLNLTITAYGGTQPQNVSVLNSRNAGRAYLLPTLPPLFDSRQVRLPKNNFFKDTLNPRQFKDAFAPLHRLLMSDKNNIKIRTAIQKHVQEIVLQVLYQAQGVRAQGVRSHGTGWSQKEYFENLPDQQRIWLDDANHDARHETNNWLDEVLSDFARWIVSSYKYLFKQDAVDLSDDELRALCDTVQEALFDEGEIFR